MSQSPEPTTTAMLVYRRDTFQVLPGQTVAEAVQHLGLHPESVLAVRAGELIDQDAVLQPGDRVKLVAIVTGG